MRPARGYPQTDWEDYVVELSLRVCTVPRSFHRTRLAAAGFAGAVPGALLPVHQRAD
jgi:hypothetical protein